MSKDNGGPAFPCEYEGSTRSDASGLSMRDYFAARAMQGLIVRRENGTHADIAENAYMMADAMLEARKQ